MSGVEEVREFRGLGRVNVVHLAKSEKGVVRRKVRVFGAGGKGFVEYRKNPRN